MAKNDTVITVSLQGTQSGVTEMFTAINASAQNTGKAIEKAFGTSPQILLDNIKKIAQAKDALIGNFGKLEKAIASAYGVKPDAAIANIKKIAAEMDNISSKRVSSARKSEAEVNKITADGLSARERMLAGAARGRETQVRQQQEREEARQRQLDGAARGRATQLARHEEKIHLENIARVDAFKERQLERDLARITKRSQASRIETEKILKDTATQISRNNAVTTQQAAAAARVTQPQGRNAFTSANINSPYTSLTGANLLKGLGAGVAASGREIVTQVGDVGRKAVESFKNRFGGLGDVVADSALKAKSRFSKIFAGNFFANIAYNAVTGFLQQLKAVTVETVVYAARTEELGVVLNALAKQNNISTTTIIEQETAIKSLNITTQDARETLARFINVGFDLNKAAPLARVAQDLAVISGLSTSDELNKLVVGIQTLQSRNLRTAGVYITVDETLDKLSATTGRARDSFSTLEKQEAVLNATLQYGEKVAGSYTAAMSTASKQMRSLERQAYEAKNALGTAFIPVMGAVISTTGEFLETVAKYPDIFTRMIVPITLATTALIAFKTHAIQGAITSVASAGLGVLGLGGGLSKEQQEFQAKQKALEAEKNYLKSAIPLVDKKIDEKVQREAVLKTQRQELLVQRELGVLSDKKSAKLLEENSTRLKYVSSKQAELVIEREILATNLQQNKAQTLDNKVNRFASAAASGIGKIVGTLLVASIVYDVIKGVNDYRNADKDVKGVDTNLAKHYGNELKAYEDLKTQYTELETSGLNRVDIEAKQLKIAQQLGFEGKAYLNTLVRQEEATGNIGDAINAQIDSTKSSYRGLLEVSKESVEAAAYNVQKFYAGGSELSERIRALKELQKDLEARGAKTPTAKDVKDTSGYDFGGYGASLGFAPGGVFSDAYSIAQLRDRSAQASQGGLSPQLQNQTLLDERNLDVAVGLKETYLAIGKEAEASAAKQAILKEAIVSMIKVSEAGGIDISTEITNIVDGLGKETIAAQIVTTEYDKLRQARLQALGKLEFQVQDPNERIKTIYKTFTDTQDTAEKNAQLAIDEAKRSLAANGIGQEEIDRRYSADNIAKLKLQARESSIQTFIKDKENKTNVLSSISDSIFNDQQQSGEVLSGGKFVSKIFDTIKEKSEQPEFKDLYARMFGDATTRQNILDNVTAVVDKMENLTSQKTLDAATKLQFLLYGQGESQRKALFEAEDTDQQSSNIERIQRLKYKLTGKSDFDASTADTPAKAAATLKSLERQNKLNDDILNAQIKLKELRDGPNKQLEALERQIKVEEGIYKFKNNYKEIEDEIAILKVTSTLPAISAQLLAEKAMLQLVQDRKQAEQQLTADIAVEISKRTKLGLDGQNIVAQTFLDLQKEETSLQDSSLSSFLKLQADQGNTALFENDPLIKEAVKQSTQLDKMQALDEKVVNNGVISIDIARTTATATAQTALNVSQIGKDIVAAINARPLVEQTSNSGLTTLGSGYGGTPSTSLTGRFKDAMGTFANSGVNFNAARFLGMLSAIEGGTKGVYVGGGSFNTNDPRHPMLYKGLAGPNRDSSAASWLQETGSTYADYLRTRGVQGKTTKAVLTNAPSAGFNFNDPLLQANVATWRMGSKNSALISAGRYEEAIANGATDAWQASPWSSLNKSKKKLDPSVIYGLLGMSSSNMASKKSFTNKVVSDIQATSVAQPITEQPQNLSSIQELAAKFGFTYDEMVQILGAQNVTSDAKITVTSDTIKTIANASNIRNSFGTLFPKYETPETTASGLGAVNADTGKVLGSGAEFQINRANKVVAQKFNEETSSRLHEIYETYARITVEQNKQKEIIKDTKALEEAKFAAEINHEKLFGKSDRETKDDLNKRRLTSLRTVDSEFYNKAYGEASSKRLEDEIGLETTLIGLKNERDYRTKEFDRYVENQSKTFLQATLQTQNEIEDGEIQLQLKIRASRDETSQYSKNIVRQELSSRNQARESVEESITANLRYTKDYLGTSQQRLDFERQALDARTKAHNDTVDEIIKSEIRVNNISVGLAERLALKQQQINEAKAGEFEATILRQIELENQLQRKLGDKVDNDEVRNSVTEKLISSTKSNTEIMSGLWLDSYDAISGGFGGVVDKMTAKLGIFKDVVGNFIKGTFNRVFSNIFGGLLDKILPKNAATTEAMEYKSPTNTATTDQDYLKKVAADTGTAMQTAAVSTVYSADNLITANNGVAASAITLGQDLGTAGSMIIAVAQQVAESVSGMLSGGGGGGGLPSNVIQSLGNQGQSGIQAITGGATGTGGAPNISPSSTVSASGGLGTILQGAAGQGIRGILPSGGRGGLGQILGGQAQNAVGTLLKGGGFSGVGKSLIGALPAVGAGLGGMLGGQSAAGSLLGTIGGGLAGVLVSTALTGGLGASAAATTALTGSSAGSGLGGVSLFGLSGAATLGIGLAIAGAFMLVSFLLGRRKRRKIEMANVNTWSSDALKQMQDLLKAVQTDKMDGQDAITQGDAIIAQFQDQIKGLKDKKSKALAQTKLSELVSLQGQIRAAADAQTRRKELNEKIVPTYATGGMNSSNLVRVSKGERLYSPDTIPYMRESFMRAGIPNVGTAAGGRGSHFNVVQIPGQFDGKDNILLNLPKGYVIANKRQQDIIDAPRYATGGVNGVIQAAQVASTAPPTEITYIIAIGDDEAERLGNMIPNAVVVGKMSEHVKKTKLSGFAGDVANAMTGY